MILLFKFHESIIVAQQGFEPSQRALSTQKERMIRYPMKLYIAQ